MGALAAAALNVAYVLLTAPSMPQPKRVAAAWRAFAPRGAELKLGAPRKPGSLSFELTGGGTATVFLMPMPVPGGEAEAHASASVALLGKGWTGPRHKAHLVVSLRDPDGTPAREALHRFTALLAAVAKASKACGVYLGGGGVTHEAKFFLKLAAEADPLPQVMLWNGVSLAREPDGRASLLSLGMRQLGLPELMLVAPRDSPRDALEIFFELLAGAAQHGKVPEPVEYVPSPIDAAAKVWRVELQ